MNNTDKILPALAKAQASYPKVGKLKKGHYGNYADMVSIMESVRKPNADADLIVIHLSDFFEDTHYYTETRVIHVPSGQWVSAKLRIDSQLTEQGLGKALTYARRYCLMGLLGICADEDTDAQEAEDEQRARKRKPTPPANKESKQGTPPPKTGANTEAGFWASARQIFIYGPFDYDKEKQNDEVRKAMGVAGFEHTADMDSVDRNALLATLAKLYGKGAPF